MEPNDNLEESVSPYDAWSRDPSSSNLNKVVADLNPTITYAVSSMGGGNDKRLLHQGRLYAAEAVKSYDPNSGASLSTWTQGQLQRLRRFKRETSGPVKVPERAQLDALALKNYEAEYLDKFGTEPDVKQLADFSLMSVKRISDVRRITRAKPSQEQMLEAQGSESDLMTEALEYVYDESDTTDRKIIEHLTGFGGQPILPKNQIAAKLGIDPAQVTRRSARISGKVTEINQDLEDVMT